MSALPTSLEPALLPRAPRDLAATGLSPAFMGDLALKLLRERGTLDLVTAATLLCLPRSVCREVLNGLRLEQLVHIAAGGMTTAEARFALTDAGRQRAELTIARCGYVGPAPVTIDDYRALTLRSSISHQRIDAATVARVFADEVLQPGVADQVGAAMNSNRAILLYGSAGSGKTYIAELLRRLLAGSVAVPHAILVGGEIVQVFDPLVHESVGEPSPTADVDRRWVECARPEIISGGELTLDMLGLQYDPHSRFYQAPPHMKANGGIYVIDDFGRQRLSPRELMNRWIVPLDRGHDYQSLHNGFKFAVPFDLCVLFSTNLDPAALADEAFLRRLGYKVHIGSMPPDAYRLIFERACASAGVDFDADAFDWLLRERHGFERRALLPAYPRDLVSRVRDFAHYESRPAQASIEALARAWATCFMASDEASASGASHPAD